MLNIFDHECGSDSSDSVCEFCLDSSRGEVTASKGMNILSALEIVLELAPLENMPISTGSLNVIFKMVNVRKQIISLLSLIPFNYICSLSFFPNGLSLGYHFPWRVTQNLRILKTVIPSYICSKTFSQIVFFYLFNQIMLLQLFKHFKIFITKTSKLCLVKKSSRNVSLF